MAGKAVVIGEWSLQGGGRQRGALYIIWNVKGINIIVTLGSNIIRFLVFGILEFIVDMLVDLIMDE